MSVYEAIMLICFGAAWPFNIYKSIKTKSAIGKSFPFLLVLLTGYIFGIIHKIMYSQDIVMGLYILNFIMVSIDSLLYFRNKQLDKKNEMII